MNKQSKTTNTPIDGYLAVSGSALIAQFDGWIKLPDFVNSDDEVYPYYQNGKRFIHYHPDKYDKEWNWIMPVIEKIEKLEVKGFEDGKEFIQQFTVKISNEQCVIHRDFAPQYWGTEEDFLELYDCRNTSKIESTFSAVVKFLEWLNSVNGAIS